MLTRADLDRLLPDTPETLALAGRLSGIRLTKMNDAGGFDGFVTSRRQDLVAHCLRWFADLTEHERMAAFVRPPWRDEDPTGTMWPIEVDGLSYKRSGSRYLIAEGWPSGTACWYVRIESGWRVFVGAETPELACLRAVVVIVAARRQREVAPKDRPDLVETIERLVAEAKVAA